MSQDIAIQDAPKTPGQIQRERFAALRAAFVAPGAVRHVTVQFGSERRGNVRMGTYVLPQMGFQDLGHLKLLASDESPAGGKRVELAATLVVGSYRAADYANSDVFKGMLRTLLETFPAFVITALLDLRDPDNLIRQSKFPPSIAEVCSWAESLIAKRKALAKDVAHQMSSASRYEAAKAEAGENLFIEWDDDNLPSAEAIKEAEARHAEIFEREVCECCAALTAAAQGEKKIDLTKFTHEVLTAAKRTLV